MLNPIRAIVRRLIAPLVRWAGTGGTVCFGVGRDEDGPALYCVTPYNDLYEWSMSPQRAREVARDLQAAARDHQEQVPLQKRARALDGDGAGG